MVGAVSPALTSLWPESLANGEGELAAVDLALLGFDEVGISRGGFAGGEETARHIAA